MTTPNNEIDLMEWQVGNQTAFDTAVAPTVKLLGIAEGKLSPLVETSEVEEQRGTLIPAFNVTLDKIAGAANLSGDVSFEQIAWVLDSLLGTATPGATPEFQRDYAGPTTTKPTSRMLTLVNGSSEGVYGLIGGIVNEASLKVETNKRATFSSSLLGRNVATDTLATLTDPSVINFAHANQMTLFLDTWAGTMGATPITATAFSFELGLNANKALKHGLGTEDPKDVSQKKLAADGNQLKLALEFEATQSKAWLDAMIGSAPFKAQIRLKFTLSATKSLQIDYCGWQKEAPELFSDSDGIAQVEMTLSPLYHATVANWLKIALVNGIADITV